MTKLIYSALASLDGYTADADGNFEWAAPDEEVHEFVNERERTVGMYLYGRRMYETMQVWDDETFADDSPVTRDYGAIWRAADKVVYSTTLTAAPTARTRIEPAFDADAVQALVASADRDVGIGGPTLAAHAIAAGLVDVFDLYVNPVIIGSGLAWLPDGVRVDLELVDEHRFTSGVVYLSYSSREGSR